MSARILAVVCLLCLWSIGAGAQIVRVSYQDLEPGREAVSSVVFIADDGSRRVDAPLAEGGLYSDLQLRDRRVTINHTSRTAIIGGALDDVPVPDRPSQPWLAEIWRDVGDIVSWLQSILTTGTGRPRSRVAQGEPLPPAEYMGFPLQGMRYDLRGGGLPATRLTEWHYSFPNAPHVRVRVAGSMMENDMDTDAWRMISERRTTSMEFVTDQDVFAVPAGYEVADWRSEEGR